MEEISGRMKEGWEGVERPKEGEECASRGTCKNLGKTDWEQEIAKRERILSCRKRISVRVTIRRW